MMSRSRETPGSPATRRPRWTRRVPALLVVLPLALPGGLAAAAGEAVVLVDDRGEPLDAPVEVCFVRGPGTECVEQAPSAGPLGLRPFDLLRVEGPRHGPATVRPGELEGGEGGPRRLAVPRKATLRVRAATEQRLTAALHAAAEPDPVRPVHRLDVPAGSEVRIPAGAWLLALEARGLAPDLHLLAAAPGSAHSIAHHPRAGWSLALRVVSRADGAAVPGAVVTLRAAPERPADEPRELTRTESLAERLPEGSFWLRVGPPEGEEGGAAEREVRLYDDETTVLDLDLSPIVVEGEVRRGDAAASGYTVRVFRTSETGSTQFVEPVAEAVSDEDRRPGAKRA